MMYVYKSETLPTDSQEQKTTVLQNRKEDMALLRDPVK